MENEIRNYERKGLYCLSLMHTVHTVHLLCSYAVHTAQVRRRVGGFDTSMCSPGLYYKGDFFQQCICVYLHNAIMPDWPTDPSLPEKLINSWFHNFLTQATERTERSHGAFHAKSMRYVNRRMQCERGVTVVKEGQDVVKFWGAVFPLGLLSFDGINNRSPKCMHESFLAWLDSLMLAFYPILFMKI